MKTKTATQTVRIEQVVASCSCHHDFQDSVYGRGMRAHTRGTKNKRITCTACGTKKPHG